MQDLGTAVVVLGAFLLLIREATAWAMPLVAMGSMILTLYSAHRIALIVEVHWDQRLLWFRVHLGVAVLFAIAWRKTAGQGPLERLVGRAAITTCRLVLGTGLGKS